MRSILNVPHYSTSDQYELARFRLTWNVNLLLSVILLSLVSLTFFTRSEYTFIYGAAFVANTTGILYMYFFKNYKVPALALSLIMFALIFLSLFTIDGYVHFLEPFWALVIVLYIYFIRGKVLGGIALAITIIATSLYFLFRMEHSLVLLHSIPKYRLYNMIFEFTACLIMIGYLINQFINANQRAEMAQRQLNDDLNREKNIVEKRNQEKTVLIQEIHHRVKNNLQIVTSLLRMQAEQVRSEEAKIHFKDAINRVLTMSLIHQKLYENDDLTNIDLSEYVNALCTDILEMNVGNMAIKRDFNIHCEQIGSKTMVPLGLIITELISNSVKHAFPHQKEASICIKIHMSPNKDKIFMHYSDNGEWKPKEVQTFGLQLIDTFTEQLEGEMSRMIEPAETRYEFVFSNLDLG
jgi:two-component sensor histidine kinase